MKVRKQTISLVLAILLLLGNFPAAAFASEENTVPAETEPSETVAAAVEEGAEEMEPEDGEFLPGENMEVQTESRNASALEAAIEKQIRAFADSIDQKNADDNAATALAKHGMTGRGKKLSVGKTHALTATLFNSELLQKALTVYCEAAFLAMRQLGLDQLDTHGSLMWDGTGGSFYYLGALEAQSGSPDWSLVNLTDYTGKRNSYDETLDWTVGGADVDMTIKRSKVTADTATYQITLQISDRFDFAISGNSGFKDLISGIGALLFVEFDWAAKVSFTINAPYACSHSTGKNHWTYDTENNTMTADASDGWTVNTAVCRTHETSAGKVSYYYELADPVRLCHDVPWVMEFDIKNTGMFHLSPAVNTGAFQQSLQIGTRSYFAVYDYERVMLSEEERKELGLASRSQAVHHYYGTNLGNWFIYSSRKMYTFRLENQLMDEGGNRILLTVWDSDTGTVLMDRVPMDDYYKKENWVKEYVLVDESSSWVSGKDLTINYIGNQTYRFAADHFDLRIWPQGESGETVSYYQDKVTKPTCEARGYTTHTCSLCGYSYKDTYVAALGHRYGDWTQVKAPDCTAAGEESRSCSVCRKNESRSIPAMGHSHEAAATPPTCTEQGYTTYTCTACGDSYVDTYVEALGHTPGEPVRENEEPNGAHDLVTYCDRCGEELEREHVEGEEETHVPGDITGDGVVNNKDLTRLFRYLSGFEVEVNEAALDITADGSVNNKDLTRLFRYLSGFDVEMF